ncbi:putative phospholipase [Helianthus annuus]|nr:putative phospholipase [Helianthus annuus]KAJ0776034.1 putative phospholipase [Helianthus annuus]
MGRTRERAWRGSSIHPLKPTQKISSITGKTKECARGNTNTQIPNKKLKPTTKLLDDDSDVEMFEPKQQHCELIEIVSSTSVSLLDDDDDDDDDVDNDGSGGDDDDDDDDVDNDGSAGDDDDDDVDNDGSAGDDDDDDNVEISTSKQEHCESVSVLAEASKKISSSVTSKADDIIITNQKEIDTTGESRKEMNVIEDDSHSPEWAQALEPRAVISVLEKVRADIPQPKPTEQEHRELDEHVSSMSDSLLDDNDNDDDDDDDVEFVVPKQEQCELLEKNSSCQSDIVCVQGYKVKRNNATILEAIFKKHGDIAANCVFKTSSTRTHFLEVVCEVVRRIQTDDMDEMVEDIECQVSDAEAANVNVSWIRAHFEAFHKRKETSKKYSLLMEMKSNTVLVKQAAQMDLRERCAELMSAKERIKDAERCVRVLHLVEKNLNDDILESKSKLDSWVDHPVV